MVHSFVLFFALYCLLADSIDIQTIAEYLGIHNMPPM